MAKSKKTNGSGKPVTDVAVKFVKELPDPMHGPRNLKYMPVLEQLIAKPGEAALLGTFKRGTASGLLSSLKETAARTKQAKNFVFASRTNAEGQVAVYAKFEK